MADDDDLYADLYAEDSTNNNVKHGDQEEDLLGYDDSTASRNDVEEKSTSKSFIPPKPGSSSTSFIPAVSTSTTTNHSPSTGGSFIPASSTTTTTTMNAQSGGMPRAQIQTAPMTNTDNARSDTADLSGMTLMQQNAIRPVLPHEMPDEGKLFVGGLNWDTTDDGLKHYFSQFGKVNHCLIMRDPSTSRSRGFAFLTFEDPKSVNSVMVKEHFLDGKMIDPKRAIPRQENIKTAKCFVGGIPQSTTSESFKTFFSQFGPLLDSTLMLDRDTQKPRGYGFVTYENDTVVERLLSMDLMLDGKQIEVKRATPRNADGTRRQPNQRTDTTQKRSDNGYNDNTNLTAIGSSSSMMGNNPMASMMMNPMFSGGFGGNNAMNSQSFDPTAMANFFQQQGGTFNPMMFQQMMMNMGGRMGGMGMGGMGGMGMGMNGMGGMGMGGMSGMSGMGMGGMGNSNSNSNNKSGSVGRSVSASAEHDNFQDQDRNSRDRSEQRGRPLHAPPSSAGLPSRPDANSTSSGRDYQRERSPERRESSSGTGSGRNVKEERW